jgi:hypothetical protein
MRTDGGLAKMGCARHWTRELAKRSLANTYAGVVPKFTGTELTIEINARALGAKTSDTRFRRPPRLPILRTAQNSGEFVHCLRLVHSVSNSGRDQSSDGSEAA